MSSAGSIKNWSKVDFRITIVFHFVVSGLIFTLCVNHAAWSMYNIHTQNITFDGFWLNCFSVAANFFFVRTQDGFEKITWWVWLVLHCVIRADFWQKPFVSHCYAHHIHNKYRCDDEQNNGIEWGDMEVYTASDTISQKIQYRHTHRVSFTSLPLIYYIILLCVSVPLK